MKAIVILLTIFFAQVAVARTVNFEGIVKDTKGNPLEMANLLAVNKKTGKTESYAITNEKGMFQLNLQTYSEYTIQVSFIGFKAKDIELTTIEQDIVQLITLEEGIELEGLEIVHEIPVKISGDTVTYNADSFSNGTERRLEDILKKLPGVEVNNGEVSMEGKPVQKILVDGKDFFEGDVKIGTKNIPADAVDKIDMLKNYNDVSQLKGLENNKDDIAMNIRLKEDKKNFWFGDLSAGAGTKERYIANPNLFYYSPKYSFNTIGNFNNIGQVPFTIEDYLKFSGGIKKMMRQGSGTNFMQIPSELFSLMQVPVAKEVTSSFGASNFTINPSKSWDISGFGIYSYNNILTDNSIHRSLLDTETGKTFSTQFTDRIKRQKTNLGLFKIGTTYKPNTKFQIDYDAFLKISKISESSSITSIVQPEEEQSQQLGENSSQRPFSIEQGLNVYHTLDNNDVISTSIQYMHEKRDPEYYADMAIAPFIFNGFIPQQRSRLGQREFTTTNRVNGKFDYYYKLNTASHLQFTLGNIYTRQNYGSHLYQMLDNGSRNDLQDKAYNNSVGYTFNDAYIGIHYKLTSGNFTFRPGLSFHSFAMDNNQLGTIYKNRYDKLLPDIDLTYDFNKSSTLAYNFAVTNDFTDVGGLAEGNVLSEFNNLLKGNRFLSNSLSKKHNLRYNFFNMYNMENGNAMLSYRRNTDAINYNSILNGVNAVSEIFNSDYANENLSGNLSYGRSFFTNYNGNVSAGWEWSKFYNSQNVDGNQLSQVPVESFTQYYNINAMTNFEKWPSLTLGYHIQINNYLNDVFYTKRPFANVEYSFFNDAMNFSANYEFFDYGNKSKTTSNNYEFLNVSMSYRNQSKKLEYKLSATNLFDTGTVNSNNFNRYSTNNSTNRIQPRYIVLSLIYKI